MCAEKIVKPNFTLGGWVPPDLVIGRTRELAQLDHILLKQKGNVLLVGNPRIGKGSLLNKLMAKFREEKVVCLYQNLLLYHDRHVTDFLQESLGHLCRIIGEVVFHKTTADMLMAARLRKNQKILDADFNRLVEIFRYIKSKESSLGSDGGIELGVNVGVAGGKGQRTDKSLVTFGSFSASDFALIADLQDLCRKHGYEQIVVILDEANNLAVATSYGILQSYLAAFRQRDAQIPFVFVATPSILTNYPHIENTFDSSVQLGFFPETEVRELLNRYFHSANISKVPFADKAIETIYWAAEGHPFATQKLSAHSIDVANAEGHAEVQSEDVMRAYILEAKQDPNFLSLWK